CAERPAELVKGNAAFNFGSICNATDTFDDVLIRSALPIWENQVASFVPVAPSLHPLYELGRQWDIDRPLFTVLHLPTKLRLVVDIDCAALEVDVFEFAVGCFLVPEACIEEELNQVLLVLGCGGEHPVDIINRVTVRVPLTRLRPFLRR